MRANVSWSLALILVGVAAGCGDDDGGGGGTDAGPGVADAGPARTDAGPPEHVEDIPSSGNVALPGLTGPVQVVRDDRGMVHIYAANMRDAFRVEGYFMAHDRLSQMEFIRRVAMGRLAELAGTLLPSLVDRDIEARFVGHRRNAQAIFDSLSADKKALLQAYADGVNVWIAKIRNGDEGLPRGTTDFLQPDFINDWTPLDTLAIARYQAAALGYDGKQDLDNTTLLARIHTEFPGDSADPRLRARARMFTDIAPFRPSRDVYTREEFPNLETDTGTRAARRPGSSPRLPRYTPPSPDVLAGAQRFMDRIEDGFRQTFGDESRGSNSWVVHGSKTMSGAPILSNDPHLSLTSPPLFWYVHIDTTRMGGDVNVEGLALAGTPVVLLGFNEQLAWGLTTTYFDTTDLYRETITPGTGGAPDTVLFEGRQVPIQHVTEDILLDSGVTRHVTFEYVPHHGYIIPDSRTPTEAISVKWTGDTPSYEPDAFVGLATAHTVDAARDAFHAFEVGHQNLVVVTRDNHIYWTTHVNMPVRDPRAMTFDPATESGFAPAFVLPGTGEYEWTGRLDNRHLPHDLDPSRGFIATANNAGVPVTRDGNPFDEAHYIGYNFDIGHRIARITERLNTLTTRGNVTTTEMSALQGDHKSPLGALLTASFVTALDHAEAERMTPGTHPELAAAITAIGAAKMSKIKQMRDRLAAWTSFETPAAVEGTPSEQEIADSVATTIFNGAWPRLVKLAFGDEYARLGSADGPIGAPATTLQFALLEPENLRTYDSMTHDTVLWDDLGTEDTVETRDERILRAFALALDFLEMRLGTDMTMWRWGKLHTLTLETTVPQPMTDVLSIPPPSDPTYPHGFPRPGDNNGVDASNFRPYDTTSYAYGSGPVQRLVVEMLPTGPRAFNAIPGGEIYDPDSPHHRDEVEHWRRNEAPPLYFVEHDVVTHAEARWVATP